MAQRPPSRPTIYNAVIHLAGEQPVVADLFELPTATDRGLLCTNLRDRNGKRPVWADEASSTFFFPLQHVRFIEIHPPSGAMVVPEVAEAAEAPEPEEAEGDLEIDEEFLRRIREV